MRRKIDWNRVRRRQRESKEEQVLKVERRDRMKHHRGLILILMNLLAELPPVAVVLVVVAVDSQPLLVPFPSFPSLLPPLPVP